MFSLKAILENIIIESIDKVQKALEKIGYVTKPGDTTKKITVLVPRKDRLATIQKISKDLGYTYYPKLKNLSSLGALVTDDGVAIIVKPDNVQGGNSAGMGNESGLTDLINSFLTQESPLDIIFKGQNNIIKYKNIDSAVRVGKDTSGYKKSDIQLLSKGKVVANISLKQDNASMWESADRRYKDVVNALTKRLINKPFNNLGLREDEGDDRIYRFYNPKTGQDYGGVIITDLPERDEEQMIFGTDTPKTIVIKHTFKLADFNLIDDNILAINSGEIFKSMDDITGTPHEPILVIRHDSRRVGSHGIRPIVYSRSFAYKNGILGKGKVEISYNKLK